MKKAEDHFDLEWQLVASAVCMPGDEGWLRPNDDSDGERCAGVSGDVFPGDWVTQSQSHPISGRALRFLKWRNWSSADVAECF